MWFLLICTSAHIWIYKCRRKLMLVVKCCSRGADTSASVSLYPLAPASQSFHVVPWRIKNGAEDMRIRQLTTLGCCSDVAILASVNWALACPLGAVNSAILTATVMPWKCPASATSLV